MTQSKELSGFSMNQIFSLVDNTLQTNKIVKKLNGWEISFLIDMKGLMQADIIKSVSPKQEAIVLKLSKKVA